MCGGGGEEQVMGETKVMVRSGEKDEEKRPGLHPGGPVCLACKGEWVLS